MKSAVSGDGVKNWKAHKYIGDPVVDYGAFMEKIVATFMHEYAHCILRETRDDCCS